MTYAEDETLFEELFKVVTKIDSQENCKKFLLDILTPQELQAIAGRWKVVQLLEKKISYREIYEMTGVSTATITRVARALSYGEGGYQLGLEILRKSKND